MLGRTHEIAAVGSVVSAAILFPQQGMTSETAIVSLLVAAIGGLTPDLDKPGSKIWDKIPAGGIISRIINPIFIGGHRHLTHSIIGMVLFWLGIKALINVLPLGPSIDTQIVALSFAIAFGSHLATDMLTKDGVPLLFPLPFHFGFPPFEFMRIRTNGFVENLFVAPGVVGVVALLAYYNSENARQLANLIGFK